MGDTSPESLKQQLDLVKARKTLRDWITLERALYADTKYDDAEENHRRLMLDMTNLGITEHSEHWTFITNYLKRAQLLGLDTPQGRQALGKTIVTLTHALERAIVLFGPMPRAGVPSGEIIE